MEFKTAISKLQGEDMILRGEKHSRLIEKASFAETIYLLLKGEAPSPIEATLFNAMLTSIIDHGIGTASALTTRFVQSTGNPSNAAVAAGVLALGDYHGGSIEQAMAQYARIKEENVTAESFVRESLAEKKVLYGYGHKVYKVADPRTRQLLELAASHGYTNEYVTLATKIESELEKQKGKKLVLNVDGCIAALLLAMGFSPSVGKGFFIIGRTPGLVAHAVEEREREKPVRRLDESEITYDGK